MKSIAFITGNRAKFREAKKIIRGLHQVSLDLPEIQEIDPRRIIGAKLMEARKNIRGPVLVEDTSLHLECLGGLPGPLIKWYLEALGSEGLSTIAGKLGDRRATATLWIGLLDSKRKVRFFNATLSGEIVPSKGSGGFGWDSVFRPQGLSKTLAEMTPSEKNEISMRAAAFENLRAFLDRVSP